MIQDTRHAAVSEKSCMYPENIVASTNEFARARIFLLVTLASTSDRSSNTHAFRYTPPRQTHGFNGQHPCPLRHECTLSQRKSPTASPRLPSTRLTTPSSPYIQQYHTPPLPSFCSRENTTATTRLLLLLRWCAGRRLLVSACWPAPGGPNRSTPDAGVIPIRENASGNRAGHTTISCTARLARSSPPT